MFDLEQLARAEPRRLARSFARVDCLDAGKAAKSLGLGEYVVDRGAGVQ